MSKLVKKVLNQNEFWQKTNAQRAKERQQHLDPWISSGHSKSHDSGGLVFNKRYFMRATTNITKNARVVLRMNGEREKMWASDGSSLALYLTQAEVRSLQYLMEQLGSIHKNTEVVKECLAHCITVHNYSEYEYVEVAPSQGEDDNYYCYHVLSGTVEVTYGWNPDNCKQIYELNVIYTNSNGEYIGLLDYQDKNKDLAPAATIYTKQPTQLIRINRNNFHGLVALGWRRNHEGKMNFMSRTPSLFGRLSEEEKRLVAEVLLKETILPNRIIIKQDEDSDFIYFVVSGRCQMLKRVPVDGENCSTLFCAIRFLETGDFFGEEKILKERSNSVSVISRSHVLLYKIDRGEMHKVGRNFLQKLLFEKSFDCPSIEGLQEKCNKHTKWGNFSRKELNTTLDLLECEKLERIRSKSAPCQVLPRSTNICTVELSEKDKPQCKCITRRPTGVEVSKDRASTKLHLINLEKSLRSKKSSSLQMSLSKSQQFWDVDKLESSSPPSPRLIYDMFDVNTALNEVDEKKDDELEDMSSANEAFIPTHVTTSAIVENAKTAALLQRAKVELKRRHLANDSSTERDEALVQLQDRRTQTLSALYFHRYRCEFLQRRLGDIKQSRNAFERKQHKRQVQLARAKERSLLEYDAIVENELKEEELELDEEDDDVQPSLNDSLLKRLRNMRFAGIENATEADDFGLQKSRRASSFLAKQAQGNRFAANVRKLNTLRLVAAFQPPTIKTKRNSMTLAPGRRQSIFPIKSSVTEKSEVAE